MRRQVLIGAAVAAATLTVSAVHAQAEQFHARLSGFNEVGGLGVGETGAILSDGTGTLVLDLDRNAGRISYTLTYSALTSVLQAHIHFGKVHVAGGIMAFLCTNVGGGPAGIPACPSDGGTVSGTIVAADIQAIPGQNVPAGDFDALVDALTSNTAYANIHTNSFKAGEIRGQVHHNGPPQ